MIMLMAFFVVSSLRWLSTLQLEGRSASPDVVTPQQEQARMRAAVLRLLYIYITLIIGEVWSRISVSSHTKGAETL